MIVALLEDDAIKCSVYVRITLLSYAFHKWYHVLCVIFKIQLALGI